jgi:hypothetical protein
VTEDGMAVLNDEKVDEILYSSASNPYAQAIELLER